jgi:hypothetical protein
MFNESTERRIQIGIEIWLGNGEFRQVFHQNRCSILGRKFLEREFFV